MAKRALMNLVLCTVVLLCLYASAGAYPHGIPMNCPSSCDGTIVCSNSYDVTNCDSNGDCECWNGE
jgi:hypothetical protein